MVTAWLDPAFRKRNAVRSVDRASTWRRRLPSRRRGLHDEERCAPCRMNAKRRLRRTLTPGGSAGGGGAGRTLLSFVDQHDRNTVADWITAAAGIAHQTVSVQPHWGLASWTREDLQQLRIDHVILLASWLPGMRRDYQVRTWMW